jgi:cephalosporin hydroxylase
MNLKSVTKTCLLRLWVMIGTINNLFVDLIKREKYLPSDLKELNEIRKYSKRRTDISDHLETIFIESLPVKPKLIVELGVREGDSLFVLERVASLCNSVIVSVDIEDCSRAGSYSKWHFIHKDDIILAKEFESWCIAREIDPQIDVMFIDTSHLYEHTVLEISSWFPLLSDRAKVLFHDTNLKRTYFRKDGSMGFGWDNQRGVIRAIEEYFNGSFNEKDSFSTILKGWVIKHYSHCCGFTILERLPYLS